MLGAQTEEKDMLSELIGRSQQRYFNDNTLGSSIALNALFCILSRCVRFALLAAPKSNVNLILSSQLKKRNVPFASFKKSHFKIFFSKF